MKKNQNGEWFVFNREYVPLGWKRDQPEEGEEELFRDRGFTQLPVHTTYFRLTDKHIAKIIKDERFIHRSLDGSIHTIFFYNDGTNPSSNPKYWNGYFAIIKGLAAFEQETQYHRLWVK